MKIQVISYNKRSTEAKNIDTSTLNKPMSLDMYDVNFIDLTSDDIWVNSDYSTTTINCINDFISIRTMLENSVKSVNIIVMPQNIEYRYNYGSKEYGKGYRNRRQLKNMLNSLQMQIMKELLPKSFSPAFVYENSETICDEIKFNAAFYIDRGYYKKVLSKSIGSDKTTTALISDRLIITTLNILDSAGGIDAFLRETGIKDIEKEKAPEWIKEIDFLDDGIQKQLIENEKLEIENAKRKIDFAEHKLAENMTYKSILYANGNELADIVCRILEKILECDLSNFTDIKKEDFLIKKDNVTFIGEIKGINSNVKSGNISQLETHYYGYIDKLHEAGTEENVKQLLIINPLRDKKPQDREPIHQAQIDLAKRNNALIIETKTLLRIFENFINSNITADKVIECFSEKSGLLELNDLDLCFSLPCHMGIVEF